ncbi:hypothetical protein ABT336_20515 [Micromonospora sp. NPDC000207]|uniref:hypothetical protein n=1 Tax=Micromonospora sp. NPDC000207 TaxID=3154246 RepID=UPI0033264F8C
MIDPVDLDNAYFDVPGISYLQDYLMADDEYPDFPSGYSQALDEQENRVPQSAGFPDSILDYPPLPIEEHRQETGGPDSSGPIPTREDVSHWLKDPSSGRQYHSPSKITPQDLLSYEDAKGLRRGKFMVEYKRSGKKTGAAVGISLRPVPEDSYRIFLSRLRALDETGHRTPTSEVTIRTISEWLTTTDRENRRPERIHTDDVRAFEVCPEHRIRPGTYKIRRNAHGDVIGIAQQSPTGPDYQDFRQALALAPRDQEGYRIPTLRPTLAIITEHLVDKGERRLVGSRISAGILKRFETDHEIRPGFYQLERDARKHTSGVRVRKTRPRTDEPRPRRRAVRGTQSAPPPPSSGTTNGTTSGMSVSAAARLSLRTSPAPSPGPSSTSPDPGYAHPAHRSAHRPDGVPGSTQPHSR